MLIICYCNIIGLYALYMYEVVVGTTVIYIYNGVCKNVSQL
jgi:hypothetical protein